MTQSLGLKSLPSLEKEITRDQIRRYSAISGDFNPIHLDDDFAARSFFGRVVAHGMLTLAFLSEMMTQAFSHHWLETGTLKVRFKNSARPGDRLRTKGQVIKEESKDGFRLVTCSISLADSRDGREIIVGTAMVYLPNDQETL
jgi:3-hydroxybutyryl-CoA dehydratase